MMVIVPAWQGIVMDIRKTNGINFVVDVIFPPLTGRYSICFLSAGEGYFAPVPGQVNPVTRRNVAATGKQRVAAVKIHGADGMMAGNGDRRCRSLVARRIRYSRSHALRTGYLQRLLLHFSFREVICEAAGQ
jgi:hypothetical protein